MPIQQQPVLQMELPRPASTSIAASRPPPSMQPLQLIRWAQRPKFATSFWEEEGTLCYQVDANSVCVARRQDNDMINGTKLLNVTGMSRGKRDGILKNEKARVVVKVGPMHLKGVWITFNRAKELSYQFKISDLLHPLFLDDPSVYFQNMQNQGPPVQFVPPNQTDISKEQAHELERYEYKDVPSFEANAFSQITSAIETRSESFPDQPHINHGVTTSAATTSMSNMTSCYFTTSSAASSSRRTSPVVSHHVYPSYNDSSSSANNSYTMPRQAPVNHFLTQESYGNHCLMGFQGSPVSIVPLATPGPAIPTTQAQENYEFQSASTQFQRFNADEMLLSAAPVPQQQQHHHQQYYCPSHSMQQQQFIPYNAPSERGSSSSSFLYTPPLSANNSTPPTPTDPSATFQFEINSLNRQRNVSQHTQNNTFVSNSYQQQQQQHQQVNGFNLFDF
ncbi:apses-type HTH transcription regulator [Mucor lusitanicus CBS 277.49]|uniref:Apses-type HTH transcription regulator n=2 Tax=Mucor circinelloides f. lusitanicus TaxID=29924 RepID=A0A168JH74_MUCCL|nr:apses-type HTH transcription regulator [Mucor lusitanicus CBS 277.49]